MQVLAQEQGEVSMTLSGVTSFQDCDMVHALIREIILSGGVLDIELSTQKG